MKFHSKNDTEYMQAAINIARTALEHGDVPVGAVVVKENKIIAVGCNTREALTKPSGHAEINALDQAAFVLGTWKLEGCDIYVTLEPCAMCSGAIIQSRIRRLYVGAMDDKAGAAGSVTDLFIPGLFNHNVEIYYGLMQEECSELLKAFFSSKR